MNGNRHPHSLVLEHAEACIPASHRRFNAMSLIAAHSDEDVQEMFEHWLRNTTLPRALPPR